MHDASNLEIRDDLLTAHRRAWQHLASPGTWFDSATRVAIARETRQAAECSLCRASKTSLSPLTSGTHDTDSTLPEVLVEALHRVRNDASRITERWVAALPERGLDHGAYIEMVAVLATTLAVDGFCDAAGLARPVLPEPIAGEPSRRTPCAAARSIAWVPTLSPNVVSEEPIDPYRDVSGMHIHQALSLVPAEVIAFFELDAAQYLPDAALRDYATEYRALTHPQIEFLAARVSAINQCVY